MDQHAKISITEAVKTVQTKKGIIIDVREPAEFIDGHLKEAINIPSTRFDPTSIFRWRNDKIILICQSGNRAREVGNNLTKVGFKQVLLMNKHMEDITVESTSNRWSVDRQFRMFLGIMIGLFLIGVFYLSNYFYTIPVILCTGLIITSIIDKCYLRMGIAMMPWNRNKIA